MVELRQTIFVTCFLTLWNLSDADKDNSTFFPPKFLKPGNMFELIAKPAGSIHILKCAAEGNPVPEITWLQDGDPLIKRGNIRKKKWSLKFDHLTKADEGIYSCILSNPLGTIDFNFTVEVLELPHRPIMDEAYPSSQTVFVGETVTFECRFLSDLQVYSRWIKYYQVNDSWTDNNGHAYIKAVQSNNPNHTNPKLLVIENVSYEDAGKYACLASNVFGNSQRTAWLTVLPHTLRQEGRCSWVSYEHSICASSEFTCTNDKCINREWYCDGTNDCGDNSDEAYCNVYSYNNCPADMRRCPGSTKCIPDEWFCDGLPDCHEGKDEICKDNTDKIKRGRMKALLWLKGKKNSLSPTEMWGSSVEKSAVALHLASDFLKDTSRGIGKEMAYEISIQLLSRISKKKLRDIRSSDLASYVNSLMVMCLNPRKFHGLDIVGELRSRINRQNYTNPYVFLALCNAGETITESDQMKLIDVFWNKKRTFWTDIQAVVVMALACANQQPGNEVDPETLRELVLELKQHQYRNGTVENLQTTALVMQAILSAEPDSDPDNFDEMKALQQMMAMQKSDGSFGSLMNTYYVLPVLNCKSLVNISSDHCVFSSRDEMSTLEDLASRSGPKIHVRYSIWIGNDKDLERTLALRVPTNMSFYGIMEMASEIDYRYRFEYIVKNRKPYISALSGLQDDPEKGKFWFLYTMEQGKPTPSQESPADVIPKDNEHFVLWYRSGSWMD